MSPEAYISYIVVHPDWRSAGIASFMIYHLIQVTSRYSINSKYIIRMTFPVDDH